MSDLLLDALGQCENSGRRLYFVDFNRLLGLESLCKVTQDSILVLALVGLRYKSFEGRQSFLAHNQTMDFIF